MGTIELRQFEYFVAVAEHLHFGRAAAALSIGQPAVSQQIARLERVLGTELLDRTPRTVRLTEPGARFLPQARAVLAAVDRARSVALDAATLSSAGVIRIGTFTGMGDRVGAFLEALREFLPGVATELFSVPVRARLERVAAGQLDAAFVHGTASAPGVELTEAWTDRLLVALPAHHALAAHEVIELRDLAALPLRIVAPGANPALVDLVIGACADAGFAPVFAPRPESLENLIAALAIGPPSWTVIYESHARMLNQSRVVFRRASPALIVLTSLAVREDASSRAIGALTRACVAAASES